MSGERNFWSRRRAGVEAEAQAVEARAAEAEAAKLEARPDDEILAELSLPEPEALDSPDAVRDFLKAELPQRLKTRALRRLWRLNPALANLDGLVDYGEDYTDAATVVENLQTAYQVGKGMLTAFVEEPDEDEVEQDAVEDPPDEEIAEEEPAPLVAQADPHPLPDPDPEPIAMPQRRMRFSFDTA
ncbi:DUF3306 domain-containing protein [Ruegeria sp. 2205SS24-7]|uniref:DUF3306 domain-containing protein n=1 Tax=Ruegeria discodermiae TaxID=3064389 RepID=UPI002740BD20|nr:DUF3306 domain-containing protein [Ruegeria sp. 2205SS24-7]MDP5219087.1 DUF3306 domain-containing protein [Ruegeria sp. 2205SS24-7]